MTGGVQGGSWPVCEGPAEGTASGGVLSSRFKVRTGDQRVLAVLGLLPTQAVPGSVLLGADCWTAAAWGICLCAIPWEHPKGLTVGLLRGPAQQMLRFNPA